MSIQLSLASSFTVGDDIKIQLSWSGLWIYIFYISLNLNGDFQLSELSEQEKRKANQQLLDECKALKASLTAVRTKRVMVTR